MCIEESMDPFLADCVKYTFEYSASQLAVDYSHCLECSEDFLKILISTKTVVDVDATNKYDFLYDFKCF